MSQSVPADWRTEARQFLAETREHIGELRDQTARYERLADQLERVLAGDELAMRANRTHLRLIK